MLITRKIGSLIRGKATPFQIISASALGMLIGFAPGFKQAPGLIVFWVLCLLILNANIFLASIAGLLGKLLLWITMPLAFAIGRFLLEGPTGGLFSALANGPITAYFGFDYYVVPGGQLLALIFGAGLGYGLTKGLGSYRRKMMQVEQDSERAKKWSSKGWVKALKFIFLGSGRGKKSYEELLSKKVGNPIRIPGVILAVVVVGLLYIGLRFLSDPVVTAAIKGGLEEANGATVDLENAHLDLEAGRLELDELALADPESLDTNLFASDRIVADISSADILKKRFSIDNLVFENAKVGTARESEGAPKGRKANTEKSTPIELPDYEDLGNLIENAPEWKERLAQVRKWLEALGGESSPDGEEKVSFEDMLASRIQALGHLNVAKQDMLEGSPMLWIRNLVATQIETGYFEGATIDIQANDLSSQPGLVPTDPKISIVSSNGAFNATLQLGAAAGRADNLIELELNDLPVDEFASKLRSDGQAPIAGGTMNVVVSGKLSAYDSDLTITPTFKGSTIRIGSAEAPADGISIPIALRGPIDRPALKLDSKAFTDAIASAGKKALLNEAVKELGIEGVEAKEGEKLQDTAKRLLGGFLNKKTEEEKKEE